MKVAINCEVSQTDYADLYWLDKGTEIRVVGEITNIGQSFIDLKKAELHLVKKIYESYPKSSLLELIRFLPTLVMYLKNIGKGELSIVNNSTSINPPTCCVKPFRSKFINISKLHIIIRQGDPIWN